VYELIFVAIFILKLFVIVAKSLDFTH